MVYSGQFLEESFAVAGGDPILSAMKHEMRRKRRGAIRGVDPGIDGEFTTKKATAGYGASELISQNHLGARARERPCQLGLTDQARWVAWKRMVRRSGVVAAPLYQ